MAGNVVELSDANFDTEVLQSEQPVLVDFWAPWCGPCRMIAPTIEELANEYQGKVKVAKLNTDNGRQVSMNFRVESIPTVMLFKGGQVVERVVGAQNKARFTSMINSHLQS